MNHLISRHHATAIPLLLVVSVVLFDSIYGFSQCLGSYELIWANEGFPDETGDIPANSTVTLTNVDGSGVDVTFTIDRVTADDNYVDQPEGVPSMPDLRPYNLGSDDLLRIFLNPVGQGNSINTAIISFSQPVVIDDLLAGGWRNISGLGASAITLFDGPNATGNVVLANQMDPASSTTFTSPNPIPGGSAINIMSNADGDQFFGLDGSGLDAGAYIGVPMNTTTANFRPWTVIDFNSVQIQSIQWEFFATTAMGQMNPGDARDFLTQAGNYSVYLGNIAFETQGNCPPVVVGDTAFIDVNSNGLQDVSDLPLGGVTVTIYDATTNIPVTFDAFGQPYVATLATDPSGFYLFDTLPDGEYYVEFDISGITDAAFYEFTTPNSGPDDIDSDADTILTGDPDLGRTASTGALIAGDTILTLDAGVQCATSVNAGNSIMSCKNSIVPLAELQATISPSIATAEWSTSGDGTFIGGNAFGSATGYQPGPNDVENGSVDLELSITNAPTECASISDQVTILIQKVNCGQFPWEGN